MINKLQLKELTSILLFVVILGVISGVLFSQVGLSAVSALMGSVPLEADMELEDMEGKYVSYEVLYPLGEYMETEKTTKVNGVSTGTKKESSSYVVVDEDRGICLSVLVPARKCGEMEELCDRFYDALENDAQMPAEGIVVQGSLERLEGEDLHYYERAMRSAELPIEDVVYHIGDGRIGKNTMSNVYGISGIALAMAVLALILIISTMKDPVRKRVNRYLAANPDVTLDQLNNDFAGAQKTGTVWVGNRWTFAANLKEVLFANRDVVWVRTGKERSGRSISFLVYVYLIDGTMKRLSMSSEKNCETVMNRYTIYPHIVTGNNPEYAYLYQHDRKTFLDMKYYGDSRN